MRRETIASGPCRQRLATTGDCRRLGYRHEQATGSAHTGSFTQPRVGKSFRAGTGGTMGPHTPRVNLLYPWGAMAARLGSHWGLHWGLILATLQPFKALETLFQATFPENSGQFAITADSGQGTRIPQPTRKAPAQLRRVTT